MMEVKFRARVKGVMIYDVGVLPDNHIWFGDDQIPKEVPEDWHEGLIEGEAGYWCLSGFELMQLTPFQDKNGKEIYAGDITSQKIEDPVEEKGYYNWHAKVTMMHGCWVLLQLNFDYSKTPFEDLTKLYKECSHVEVIGDIHTYPVSTTNTQIPQP